MRYSSRRASALALLAQSPEGLLAVHRFDATALEWREGGLESSPTLAATGSAPRTFLRLPRRLRMNATLRNAVGTVRAVHLPFCRGTGGTRERAKHRRRSRSDDLRLAASFDEARLRRRTSRSSLLTKLHGEWPRTCDLATGRPPPRCIDLPALDGPNGRSLVTRQQAA